MDFFLIYGWLLQEDLLLLRAVHHCWLRGARDRDDRGTVGAGFAMGLDDAGVRLFAMIYDWPALYYKIYQEVRMLPFSLSLCIFCRRDYFAILWLEWYAMASGITTSAKAAVYHSCKQDNSNLYMMWLLRMSLRHVLGRESDALLVGGGPSFDLQTPERLGWSVWERQRQPLCHSRHRIASLSLTHTRIHPTHR